ncbi:hypothetical protein [Solilutibacter silvestris]|uniref:hypothetical protein n=1 Tax=Solilutibacter silvestris TaxID=1645665 RepID=UPI003D3293C6
MARSGNNFAELNAEAASRIYQNVCLINGESFNWTFSHRGRNSSTTRDVAAFKVGASQEIVRVGTTNTGATDTPIPSAGVTVASGGNGWVDYSGNYTYSGATGINSLGFEAISSSGGVTQGNLLDNIQIQIAPFVEFVQSSSSGLEAAGNNLPQIRVNGTVFSAMTVTVTITGGTATRGATGATGVDYTTAGGSATLTINVPAGIYDGTAATSSLFTVPVTIVDNTTVQSNRTIQFQVQASGATPKAYLLNSSSTCGAAAQATSTYTIIDDDAKLTMAKNVTSYAQVAGSPDTFDIGYTITVANTGNGNAIYGLTDTPGFDPDVSIVSASYTLNGGSANALAGAGPWTLQPAGGRTLASGSTDTYVLTVRGKVSSGGSTANDACTGASGHGLYNQATATLQNPLTTINANACRDTMTPGRVALAKTLNGRTTAGDQAQVRIYAGGIQTNTASTSGATAPATAITGAVLFAAGTAIELRETILQGGTTATAPSTGYATSISCSNAATGSGTVLPTGSGAASGTEQAWSGIALAAGDDISCTITNTPKVDLSITKSNGTTTVTSGGSTVYTIVASNAGPAAANGATLKDALPTGLSSCPTLTCDGSAATGGAVCPAVAAVTPAALQAGTLSVNLPAGSSLTFKLSCNVQ